jgi:nucleoid DNA-binding protein
LFTQGINYYIIPKHLKTTKVKNMQNKSGKIHFNDLTTITKVTLAENLSARLGDEDGYENLDTRPLIESFVNVIKNALMNKQSVMLFKLGTLAVKFKEARNGARNPKTGEPCMVSARHVVTLNKTFKTNNKIKLHEIVDLTKNDNSFTSELSPAFIRKAFKLFLIDFYNLAEGNTRIEIRGLGVFYPALMKERNARNPKTGETLRSKEYIKTAFKCSDMILNEINSELSAV